MSGGLVGGVAGTPIEHLRTADLTEALFLPAEQFRALWHAEAELRHWCAAQAPAAEVVDLALQLSHANPARNQQLEAWPSLVQQHRQAREEMGADSSHPPTISGGQWHWPEGTVWPERPSQRMDPERLIWLPDPPDYEMVAISSEIDTIVDEERGRPA